MRKLATLIAVGVLAGCQTASKDPFAKNESQTPPAPQASGGSTSPTTPPPTSTTGSPPPAAANTSGDNPQRVYQLRELKKVTLHANGHAISAWVMDDEGKRQEGMMWLTDKEVKPDEGMIFVFAKPDDQSFWMENTILPLDIIYISSAKKVINVQPGKPFDKSPLPSKGPAQFVLEMKQGSAKRLGIGEGTPIEMPSDLHRQ